MSFVKEYNENFYIAESTQKGAGYGLFAVDDLEEGYSLEIVGVVAESRECVKFADNYSVTTAKGECFIPLGFGAIVNHASNPTHQNVEFTHEKGWSGHTAVASPVYRALRAIKKDEEILTSYGPAFANILAVKQILEQQGNIVDWEQECEDIADSKEGKELYEKVFESIFTTS